MLRPYIIERLFGVSNPQQPPQAGSLLPPPPLLPPGLPTPSPLLAFRHTTSHNGRHNAIPIIFIFRLKLPVTNREKIG